MLKNIWRFGALIGACMLMFSGCGTSALQTKVKMTQSIFLDPVARDKRTIFVAMRNTSGQNIYLEGRILESLRSKGYMIVDDPEMATYILMANVLYCDVKREENASGAAAAGAMTGTSIGAYNGNSMTTTIGSGVAGALVGGLIGKMTEDTIYQMQVDILVKQRMQGKVVASSGNVSGQASVTDGTRAGFMNSFGGPVRDTQGGAKVRDNRANYATQSYESDYVEKQTMLFAEATKMGLTLEEAIPALESQITNQISGIF